jgi:hypothetical protein
MLQEDSITTTLEPLCGFDEGNDIFVFMQAAEQLNVSARVKVFDHFFLFNSDALNFVPR